MNAFNTLRPNEEAAIRSGDRGVMVDVATQLLHHRDLFDGGLPKSHQEIVNGLQGFHERFNETGKVRGYTATALSRVTL